MLFDFARSDLAEARRRMASGDFEMADRYFISAGENFDKAYTLMDLLPIL